MPEPFRVRFLNFSGIDYSSAQRVTMPRPSPPAMGEQTLLRAGITTLSAAGNQKGQLLADALLRVSGAAPMSLTGTIPGARVPFASEYTLAEGLTSGAGAVAAYSLGGGIYFWRKNPGFEFGLYGGLSVGMVTNIGVSSGMQVAYFFGPMPATLAGDSVAVSVSVDLGPASVAGTLYLSGPPGGFVVPTGSTLSAMLTSAAASLAYVPTVIGVGYSVTAGISVLPVDISVMPGRTWTTAVVSR